MHGDNLNKLLEKLYARGLQCRTEMKYNSSITIFCTYSPNLKLGKQLDSELFVKIAFQLKEVCEERGGNLGQWQ